MIDEKKAVEAVRVIKRLELEMCKKVHFHQEHNFELEALKFRHTEDVLRKLAMKIEDIFDIDYVPVNDSDQ